MYSDDFEEYESDEGEEIPDRSAVLSLPQKAELLKSKEELNEVVNTYKKALETTSTRTTSSSFSESFKNGQAS